MKKMSDIERKLINNDSENNGAKMNLITISIGAILMIFGVILFIIKNLTFEYIDESGYYMKISF